MTLRLKWLLVSDIVLVVYAFANLGNTLTAMSIAYASCYEAVFPCSHSKGSQISHAAAAKYKEKSKSFIIKRVQQYKKIKNVHDLSERGLIGKVTPNMQ
ncbi:hypothetical protein Trydic_g3767 [Trypoxylus dichotomus]